jgi:hypothetical protein
MPFWTLDDDMLDYIEWYDLRRASNPPSDVSWEERIIIVHDFLTFTYPRGLEVLVNRLFALHNEKRNRSQPPPDPRPTPHTHYSSPHKSLHLRPNILPTLHLPAPLQPSIRILYRHLLMRRPSKMLGGGILNTGVRALNVRACGGEVAGEYQDEGVVEVWGQG